MNVPQRMFYSLEWNEEIHRIIFYNWRDIISRVTPTRNEIKSDVALSASCQWKRRQTGITKSSILWCGCEMVMEPVKMVLTMTTTNDGNLASTTLNGRHFHMGIMFRLFSMTTFKWIHFNCRLLNTHTHKPFTHFWNSQFIFFLSRWE